MKISRIGSRDEWQSERTHGDVQLGKLNSAVINFLN